MTATQPLPETTTHFRLIARGTPVPQTTGQRTFITERRMFLGHFDWDFKKYKTNVPCGPLPEAAGDLYEMIEGGNFNTLLSSFNLELDLLFWRSQDQIISWVEKHPKYFGNNDQIVYFPFIARKKHLVANVLRADRELRTFVYHFRYDYVWDAKSWHRFLFPQVP